MPTQVPEPAADSVALVALLAHASRNASGQGAGVTLAAGFRWLSFELVCTAASGGGGASLVVYVQQSLDGGVNWDDVWASEAILGTAAGGVLFYASGPVWDSDAAGEVHVQADGSLGPLTWRGTVLGRLFRVRWTIAGGGTFSFQVLAIPRA
jgi:hypothetical protein